MGTMHFLAVGLGAFFAVSGAFKVIPIQPVHGHMVSAFREFASVFPLKYVGFQPDPDMYRCVIGVGEVGFGLLLAFGRHGWRRISCVSLLVIMIGALQTLIALSEPIAKMVPALTCGALLILLLLHRDGFRGKSHLD